MGSYDQIFESVSSGSVAAGVIPVEDSISGTFHSVYDALLEHKDLYIVGEHAASTECCLCVVPGADRAALTQVRSNPEILRQCAGFLGAMGDELQQRGRALDGLAWIPALNSAECARALQRSGATDTAVICSRQAASLYGLEIAEPDISDVNVSTRYLVVGRARATLAVGQRLKSSIVFALPNEPLAIFKAISAFALRGLNISKIESRPSAALGDRFAAAYHWEYVFYMDVELPARHGGVAVGGVLDAALANLGEFAVSVRELGRYAQNLGKDDRVFQMKPADIVGLAR